MTPITKNLAITYYAILREQRGLSEEHLESAATTPGELYEALRVQHGFLRVLQRQQAGQLARAIGHQKLFDAARFHQADGRLTIRRFAQDRQIIGRHHHRNQ